MGVECSGLSDQDNANILLAQSVMRGDVADVVRALEMGADANTTVGIKIANMKMGFMWPAEISGNKKTKNICNITVLMRAAKFGYVDVVQALVDRGASPLLQDSRGWSTLCYALANGELQVAQHLVSRSGSEKKAILAVAHKRREGLLRACEKEFGADAADRVRRELEPPGFLILPAQQTEVVDAVDIALN